MKFVLAVAFASICSLAPGKLIIADLSHLGRGINLGNFLEAPNEGAWTGGQTLQESDFGNIQQAGFTFIRVPICWSAHVGPAPDFRIDPAFLARIDWVVAQAQNDGLFVILDYHNDDALMKNPETHGDRFVDIWSQIAAHYKDAPPAVLFEILNEPNGRLDARHWNALLARTLTAVRATNPTRSIVVGPVQWNSISRLNELVLPAGDAHLLVTVHYYEPFHFTHQGADWIGPFMTQYLGTKWLGTDAEKKAVTDDFDQAAKWGADHRRPMYLGEFGAFGKGDIDSRARWTSFVARTAEAHGMAWSYWEYDQGFGAYDPIAKQWRAPLLHALLPAGASQ
jgi:endoglucanase